jgi:hypothetical protein
MTTYRGENVTIYSSNNLEVIVHGSGSDWIVQIASSTNPHKPWRSWYGNRNLAEESARDMIAYNDAHRREMACSQN